MRLTRGENDLDEAEARVQDLKQKADMFRSLLKDLRNFDNLPDPGTTSDPRLLRNSLTKRKNCHPFGPAWKEIVILQALRVLVTIQSTASVI